MGTAFAFHECIIRNTSLNAKLPVVFRLRRHRVSDIICFNKTEKSERDRRADSGMTHATTVKIKVHQQLRSRSNEDRRINSPSAFANATERAKSARVCSFLFSFSFFWQNAAILARR